MIYFIVNLSGGGGRAKRTWRKIKEAIKEYEDGIDDTIDYKAYLTKYAGHATEIASKLSAKIKTKDPDSNIIAVNVGETATLNVTYTGNKHIWFNTMNNNCSIFYTFSSFSKI